MVPSNPPPHNLSLNLTNKPCPLANTVPFPSSNTPWPHTFLPSVLSTQLLHSTTPGIGNALSYLTVNSAVAHPGAHCTNMVVPSVWSSNVAMRQPCAKSLFRVVAVSVELDMDKEGWSSCVTYLEPPLTPSSNENMFWHSPGPCCASVVRGLPLQRSGGMKPL